MPVVIESGFLARQCLPALNDDVDVLRIQFDSITDALGQFGGRKRRARTEEWIVNQFAEPEVIQNRRRISSTGF